MAKKQVFQLINNLFYHTRDIIISLTDKDLSGEQKKAILDERIANQVVLLFAEFLPTKNPVLFIVKKIVLNYLLDNISVITQAIYNLIKLRVKGITEDAQ